jgi:DNA-binding IclR family transcriptional regulator
MAPPRKPNNHVQTIERVSLILDVVGQNLQGISLGDIAAGLNLPKGTVHRILSSLSHYGFVRQDGKARNYFLGLKLMDLGTRLANQLDLRRTAEPALRALADKTRETVHLVLLDHGEIVYIDKIEIRQDTGGLTMASRLGARNPAHCCAVGKALLSHLPEEALEEFIREKGLPPRTANTITDPDRFRGHLQTVRSQGYAVDDEENERGIRCVAAAILNEKGLPAAAISVSGPAFRITKKLIQESIRHDVVRTAKEISRQLGYRENR